MTDESPQAPDLVLLIRELRQLVEALDRRVPHIERAGETEIARESAELRARALQRIAELEQDAPSVT